MSSVGHKERTVNQYTYRDIIRHYSADVAKGSADTDLKPRERRLASVMLNLASNASIAMVYYPPTEPTREIVVHHLSDIVWDARPLVDACSPASGDAFQTALDRAIVILRGV
jgi:hypothetical protein